MPCPEEAPGLSRTSGGNEDYEAVIGVTRTRCLKCKTTQYVKSMSSGHFVIPSCDPRMS